MVDWEDFKFDIPLPGAAGAETFVLETVSHIAHLKDARRILEDGVLRAGLVNDGSRLDSTRTRVTFYSANTWGIGSIYGNVQWRFNWTWLVSDRKIYWVEKRTTKKFPVYRFLISDRDPAAFPELMLYNPAVDNGPLREDAGNWYCKRNGCVSEFLFDGDLSIDLCTDFDFVDHNASLCRTNGCRDLKINLHNAAAQTMAFVLGSNVRTLDNILQRPGVFRKDKRLADTVELGLNEFLRLITLSQAKRPTGTIGDLQTAVALIRGAMALYGSGQIDRARDIVRNLESEEVLAKAVDAIVEEHFEIENWRLVED